MFGRRFNTFDDHLVKEQEKYDKSIENRFVELKRLFDETHEAAQNNIVKAQLKQVNTQNNQQKTANEPLQVGTVYLKDCRLIKGKMEPFCDGPYLIKNRNIDSGNYILGRQKWKQNR